MLKLKKILKIGIIRKLTLLISGTLCAQLIVILSEPILKKLYDPLQFGELSIFLKFFQILVILSTLSYNYSIVTAEKESEAEDLVKGNILLNLIFFVISEVIIFGILNYYKISKLYLIFLPLSVLFYSLAQTFNNFLIRNSKFDVVSKNKVVRRASEVLIQIGFKYFIVFGKGLIIGNIFGNLFYCVYNFKNIKLNYNFKIQSIKKAWIKNINFPKYNLLPSLFQKLGNVIFDLTILKKFGLKEVGYLELTQKLLLLPSALLSESFGRIILKNTSEKINKKESIKKELLFIGIFLGIISFVYLLIILICGEKMIILIFGNKWVKSAEYSKFLIFYVSVSLLIGPFEYVVIALNKLRIKFYYNITKVSFIFILNFLCYKNIKIYLFTYTCINIVLDLIFIVFMYIEVNSYEKTLKRIKK